MKTIWLTVQEAAQISGYHPEYVRQLVREGKVNAQKFSIVWMVDRDSLLEYVKDQEKSSQDQETRLQ